MSVVSHPEVVFVHSSDLHLGPDSSFGPSATSNALANLNGVLAVAKAESAALVILAGDTFENNRQSSQLLDQVMRMMGASGAPIVILPGNHDPLSTDSIYRRAELAIPPNVHVLGLTNNNAILFPELGLEVWGRAHLDYSDMSPLREPHFRSMPWQVATAHGHYVEEPEETGRFLGSWLIRRNDLNAVGVDYVALGHWNRAAQVGDAKVNAFYSGSPDYARKVNVVRFRANGAVEVKQTPLPSSIVRRGAESRVT